MDEDLLEESKDGLFSVLWRNRKIVIWLLFILVALVLIFSLRLSHKRQEELRQQMEKQNQQMEYQQQLIAALRANNGTNNNNRSVPVITSDTIKEQLNSIQELVTQEYIYTNSDKGEDSDKWIFGWDRPFSEKSYIVTYDGSIKTGIDLSEVTVEVDEDSRTITVVLPDSKITDNIVDQESVVYYNIKNGLFNDVTSEDFKDLIVQGQMRMEQKAIERGVLTKASEEAQDLVESFLSLIPGIGTGEGEYTLTVQTKS